MVVGSPRCCTEEGVGHNFWALLHDVQGEKPYGALKMSRRLAALARWRRTPLASFWRADRSRAAPRRWTPPGPGIYRHIAASSRLCVCLKKTEKSLPVWRDTFLALLNYLQILEDIYYLSHGWNLRPNSDITVREGGGGGGGSKTMQLFVKMDFHWQLNWPACSLTLCCLSSTTDSGPSSYKYIYEENNRVGIILPYVRYRSDAELEDHYHTVGWVLTLFVNTKHTETVLPSALRLEDDVSLGEVHNPSSFYGIIVFVKDTGRRGVLMPHRWSVERWGGIMSEAFPRAHGPACNQS